MGNSLTLNSKLPPPGSRSSPNSDAASEIMQKLNELMSGMTALSARVAQIEGSLTVVVEFCRRLGKRATELEDDVLVLASATPPPVSYTAAEDDTDPGVGSQP